MKTCIHLDEYGDNCGALVEGTTQLCARHNFLRRKAERQALKDSEKLALKILKSKEQKPRANISKVSEKMKVKNAEYGARVREWKKENPECKAMCSPDCDGVTDDCHHKRGRGQYLMDETTWLPVCRSCHVFITDNSKYAMEHGFTESRLAIDQTKPVI